MTCGLAAPVITLDCLNEDCAKPILLAAGYEGCPECGHNYEPGQIASVLEEHEKVRVSHHDDPDDVSCACCGNCDGYETVVPLATGMWFCTDCFDIENHVGVCEWCAGYSTHMPEDTFLGGCSQCEGRLGHDKDD